VIARNLDPQRGTPRARRTRDSADVPVVSPVRAHGATRAPTRPHGAPVREIAALMAAGYVRAVLSGGYPGSPNPLALRADHEPSCQANADTRQRTPTPARDGEHP
jgi:hypothetical protein